jgi:hypothetical protein
LRVRPRMPAAGMCMLRKSGTHHVRATAWRIERGMNRRFSPTNEPCGLRSHNI